MNTTTPSQPHHSTTTMSSAGVIGAGIGVFVKLASNSMRKLPFRRGECVCVLSDTRVSKPVPHARSRRTADRSTNHNNLV